MTESTTPQPERKSLGLLFAYTGAAAALTIIGTLVIAAVVPNDYPSVPLGVQLIALLMALAIGVLLWLRDRVPHVAYAAVLALGTGLALGFYTLFKATPFGLNGFDGDAWFCNAAVTRFSETWSFADFGYRDLPSFYPPLYFWVLGKLAVLSEGPAFTMWRNGVIIGGFVYPILLFWIYRKVIGTAAAAVYVGLVFLLWNDIYLYKPYTFVAHTLFVWWVLHFIGRPSLDVRSIVAGSVVGAVIFQINYYAFFVLAVALAVIVAYHLVSKRAAELTANKSVLLVLIGAVVLSSLYWAPLLSSLATPGAESIQNRWFQDKHLEFWSPFRGVFNISAVLALLGLGYLVAQKDRASRLGLVLFVSCYAWYATSYATSIGLDLPLLHFRTNDLVPLVVAPFAALAVVAIFKAVAQTRFAARVPAWATLAAVVFVGFGAQRYFLSTTRSDLYRTTFAERYVTDPQLDRFLQSNLTDKVLLGGLAARRLSAQYPVYSFIAPSAFFSHPAGKFSERLGFLSKISRMMNSERFAQQLADNPFDRVDFVLLRQAQGEEHGANQGRYFMTLYDSDYPRGAKGVAVYFAPQLFQEPRFTRIPFPFGELFRVNHGGS